MPSKILSILILLILCVSCKHQVKKGSIQETIPLETTDSIASQGPIFQNFSPSTTPQNITRTIIQDRKRNIWIAAFDGVFKYDGTSFTNITSTVSSARFFSVLEDKKGNFWFSTVGSGVYHYDGISFQNFTTKDGLANDRVTAIYEDKSENIWFGTEGGVSKYNGKTFQNFTIKDGLTSNSVNTIVEDAPGKLWFGTTNKASIYNGKAFTVVTHKGKPFVNVRTIIEDKEGNIWLGGKDGLWRYDGSTFANFSDNFTGSIYEDKSGNIWTSSQRSTDSKWMLSRFDKKSLSINDSTVREIESPHEGNKGMIFTILEADDGIIWYGALDGAHRYDNNTNLDFKD